MVVENKSNRFKNLMEDRLARYGAAAVVALAGGAPGAEAAVIVFDGGNLGTGGSNGFVFFNLPSGATTQTFPGTGTNFGLSQGTITGASFLSRGASAFAGPDNGGRIAGESSSSAGFLALRLGTGQLINGAMTFGSAALLASSYSSSFSSGKYGNWLSGGRGFLGLIFSIGQNTHYGWANISLDAASFEVTLHCFAYEDQAGGGITTPDVRDACATSGTGGEVPEPHSAALLALGAAGLTAYRRRRASRNAA